MYFRGGALPILGAELAEVGRQPHDAVLVLMRFVAGKEGCLVVTPGRAIGEEHVDRTVAGVGMIEVGHSGVGDTTAAPVVVSMPGREVDRACAVGGQPRACLPDAPAAGDVVGGPIEATAGRHLERSGAESQHPAT